MDNQYSVREIDHRFKDIKESLDRIEIQTTKHNGRLSRVEKAILIVGCVTATLLISSGSELVGFVKSII